MGRSFRDGLDRNWGEVDESLVRETFAPSSDSALLNKPARARALSTSC